MTNMQQPEMRRNEHNPTVQDSKRPGPSDRPRVRRGRTGPVPAAQTSPYGPSPRPGGGGTTQNEGDNR